MKRTDLLTSPHFVASFSARWGWPDLHNLKAEDESDRAGREPTAAGPVSAIFAAALDPLDPLQSIPLVPLPFWFCESIGPCKHISRPRIGYFCPLFLSWAAFGVCWVVKRSPLRHGDRENECHIHHWMQSGGGQRSIRWKRWKRPPGERDVELSPWEPPPGPRGGQDHLQPKQDIGWLSSHPATSPDSKIQPWNPAKKATWRQGQEGRNFFWQNFRETLLCIVYILILRRVHNVSWVSVKICEQDIYLYSLPLWWRVTR